MHNTSLPSSSWLTPNQLASRIDHLFNENNLLWLLRNRESNGLAEHVRKVNGRVFISFPGFCEWFGETPESITQWSTLPQFIQELAGLFSPSSALWLIRNRRDNGLAPFVKKVNGRLFMNTNAIYQHLFP